MSPADLRRLKDAYNEAAKNFPHLDRPLMSMGTKLLSMRELANEVENETLIGKRLIKVAKDVIASGSTTLDQIVAQISRKPPQP